MQSSQYAGSGKAVGLYAGSASAMGTQGMQETPTTSSPGYVTYESSAVNDGADSSVGAGGSVTALDYSTAYAPNTHAMYDSQLQYVQYQGGYSVAGSAVSDPAYAYYDAQHAAYGGSHVGGYVTSAVGSDQGGMPPPESGRAFYS